MEACITPSKGNSDGSLKIFPERSYAIFLKTEADSIFEVYKVPITISRLYTIITEFSVT